MRTRATLILALAAVLAPGTWARAQQGGHEHQPAPPAGQAAPGSQATPVQPAHGMGPMMGPGMGPGTGMMRGMLGGPANPLERPIISEILAAKDRLGLTPEQEQKLRRLRTDFEKESIRRGAEIQAAEVDLRELLAAEPPDLAKIETQVKNMAALQADLRFARIKTLMEGRGVPSKEQWQKFAALAPRPVPMGPGRGRGMPMQPGQQGGIGMGTDGMMDMMHQMMHGQGGTHGTHGTQGPSH